MKKIISIATAILLSIETLYVVVMAFICAPSTVNAYGYYNDNHDLSRFDGIKGWVFNWFTWILEPSTTSIDEDLLSLSLCILFMGMLLGAFLLTKKLFTTKVPNYLLLSAGAIVSYLALYLMVIRVV